MPLTLPLLFLTLLVVWLLLMLVRVLVLVLCCVQVVEYLTETENMLVVVEPHMYDVCAQQGLRLDNLFTFQPDESKRCVVTGWRAVTTPCTHCLEGIAVQSTVLGCARRHHHQHSTSNSRCVE